MNFKKFISGVSALAIAASAFAGMAVTANAAATEWDYTTKWASATDQSVTLQTRETDPNDAKKKVYNSDEVTAWNTAVDALNLNNKSGGMKAGYYDANSTSKVELSYDATEGTLSMSGTQTSADRWGLQYNSGGNQDFSFQCKVVDYTGSIAILIQNAQSQFTSSKTTATASFSELGITANSVLRVKVDNVFDVINFYVDGTLKKTVETTGNTATAYITDTSAKGSGSFTIKELWGGELPSRTYLNVVNDFTGATATVTAARVSSGYTQAVEGKTVTITDIVPTEGYEAPIRVYAKTRGSSTVPSVDVPLTAIEGGYSFRNPAAGVTIYITATKSATIGAPEAVAFTNPADDVNAKAWTFVVTAGGNDLSSVTVTPGGTVAPQTKNMNIGAGSSVIFGVIFAAEGEETEIADLTSSMISVQ